MSGSFDMSAFDILAIAARFAVPGQWTGAERFTGGLINASWLATSENQGTAHRYLLQQLNTRVFPQPDEVMANIRRVTEHLAATGGFRETLSFVPVREPSPGEPLLHREPDGSCWRLCRFIENTRGGGAVAGPDDAATAGRAFGRFLRQLADFPAETLHPVLPGFHDTPARCAALEQAIAANTHDRVVEAETEIAAIGYHLHLAGSLLDLHHAGRLPLRVVHNDAKFSNVLLDVESGAAVCVVDLDTVMPGLAPYDFGDMVRTMTSRADEEAIDLDHVAVDPELCVVLAGGYLEEAGEVLTPDERQHLVTAGTVIIFEQAVRFLADYLAGDQYYHTTHPGHNLQRARNQLRLLESLLEQQKDIESTISRR